MLSPYQPASAAGMGLWQGQSFLTGPGRSDMPWLKVGEGKENNVLMTAPVALKEGLEWELRKGRSLLNCLDFPSQWSGAGKGQAGNVSSGRPL